VPKLITLVVFATLLAGLLALPIMTPIQTRPLHAQDSDYEPQFEFGPCFTPFPEEEIVSVTYDCGLLTVPEDRSNPDGRQVELAVVILYATGPEPADSPIVYLEGGPGGSAVLGFDAWLYSPYRETFDIILIDQRGTGFSLPSLDCYELLEAEEDEDPLVQSQACYDRLVEAGVNLASYNSAENADDIADLIVALDYEQANLYGISYGTRLALTVMRDRPERVRAVVLDSTYPPNVQGYEEQAPNAQRAFDTLFEYCQEDSECNSAYPNLDVMFYDTVEELNENPALVSDFDPATDEEYEYDVYGDDLVNSIFSAMYSTQLVPFLPAVIDAAAAGEYEVAFDLLDGLYIDDESDAPYFDMYEFLTDEEIDYFTSISDAEGMFNAVECFEEVHFNSLDVMFEGEGEMEDIIFETMMIDNESMFDECVIWGAVVSDGLENAAVESDIPTLVLAGDFDPITPPGWGEVATETLSNSYFYTFPGVGHGAIDGGECPVQIGIDFLMEPTTEPDTSCLDKMSGPAFYIR
jgi:pimeloyl-ACP methyl ester carboxylesterase